MRLATVRTDSGDDRLNPVLSGVGVSHPHDHDGAHGQESLEHDSHVPVEAVAPTTASRSVVINVGEHLGALVLASSEARAGLEVEIHPVSQPERRSHVWVLPREGREGVVYAAIFPSLEIGDYAIIDVDGAIAEVVAVAPNTVTHAAWT